MMIKIFSEKIVLLKFGTLFCIFGSAVTNQKADKNCNENRLKLTSNNNSWQTNKKKSNALNYLTAYDSEPEKEKEVDVNCKTKSTLSLHISAYENGTEVDSMKLTGLPRQKNTFVKTQILSLGTALSNPFEFPRQQENQASGEPEIMQFSASQQLRKPNEPSSSSRKQRIDWKEPQMLQLLDDFIDGKVPMTIEEFANHVNRISDTETTFDTIRNRVYGRQRERRMSLQANSTPAGETAQNGVEAVAPVQRMDQPASNDDTVTYAELYQAYVNFWNSLNACVDEEYKLIPENGVSPTYQEAKNLWKSMKNPRRRKLLWVATGFTHAEFPDDEAQFRQEEAAGLINDTHVTTGADAEDESSDDEDFPDFNDENVPPVVNLGVDAPQDALVRHGGPAEIQNISSDEDAPQDPINANDNNTELSLTGAVRPETPREIRQGSTVADPVPSSTISPVLSQMGTMNLAATNATTVAPVLSAPAVASSPITAPIPPVSAPAAPEAGNEIVEDSQKDGYDDAVVETVYDHDMVEQPDISPPRSPVHDFTSSQLSVSSDSPVPTPQSSYPNSQIPTAGTTKDISPPKRRRIIVSDDDDEDMKIKPESNETSFMDEQIFSPENQKKPAQKGPSKPSTSKPPARSRTRSGTKPSNKVGRKTKRGRSHESDSDYNEESMPSADEDNVPAETNQVLRRLESDNESEDSSSTLGSFIVDDEDDIEADLSDDESITLSDSQKTRNSQESDASSASTLNDEIYTHDDLVERDLPSTVPKAIVKNTPTTPKTTPLLAHVGKSRYASDAATTPRRFTGAPLSSRTTQFNQTGSARNTAPITQRRVTIDPTPAFAGKRGSVPAAPVNSRRGRSVEKSDTTRAQPARSRQRSGEPSASKPRQRSIDPSASKPRQRSIDPSASRPRQRSNDPSASKPRQRSIDPSASKPRQRSIDPSTSRPRQRSTDPSAQFRGPSADSRRSTSIRFGSAARFVEENSNSSRPSSANSRNSSIPDGYELIEPQNYKKLDDNILIIYVQNGKKYCRKYRPQGDGYFNQNMPCRDFECIKCSSKGKQTMTKIIKRNGKIYSDMDHIADCVMKLFDLDDED